jgi:putative DNA methylase
MTNDWDPKQDKVISIWEVTLRVAYLMQTDGIEKASEWLVASSTRVDIEAVKELSYLLFSLSEKKSWSESATLFNGLGSSWSDLYSTMHKPQKLVIKQDEFGFEE